MLKGKPCDHLINLLKEVVGGDRKIGSFSRFPAIILTSFDCIPAHTKQYCWLPGLNPFNI